jgi:hypothetical protein
MKTSVSKLALSLICLLGFSGVNSVHADVKTKAEDGTIEISVSGKPVLTYHTETVSPPDGMDKVYARMRSSISGTSMAAPEVANMSKSVRLENPPLRWTYNRSAIATVRQ